jgi:hypothetical protein
MPLPDFDSLQPATESPSKPAEKLSPDFESLKPAPDFDSLAPADAEGEKPSPLKIAAKPVPRSSEELGAQNFAGESSVIKDIKPAFIQAMQQHVKTPEDKARLDALVKAKFDTEKLPRSGVVGDAVTAAMQGPFEALGDMKKFADVESLWNEREQQRKLYNQTVEKYHDQLTKDGKAPSELEPPSATDKIGRLAFGVAHGAAGLGDFIASPFGVITGELSAIPETALAKSPLARNAVNVVQNAFSLGFGAQMASALPAEVSELYDEAMKPEKDRDWAKVGALAISTATTPFFAKMAIQHGLRTKLDRVYAQLNEQVSNTQLDPRFAYGAGFGIPAPQKAAVEKSQPQTEWYFDPKTEKLFRVLNLSTKKGAQNAPDTIVEPPSVQQERGGINEERETSTETGGGNRLPGEGGGEEPPQVVTPPQEEKPALNERDKKILVPLTRERNRLVMEGASQVDPRVVALDAQIKHHLEENRQTAANEIEMASVKPEDIQSLRLTPALMVDGKPVTGGANHNAIYEKLVAEAKARGSKSAEADAHEAKLDDSAHVFIDRAGRIQTRETAKPILSKMLGKEITDPVHSEMIPDRFKDLPKPAEPSGNILPKFDEPKKGISTWYSGGSEEAEGGIGDFWLASDKETADASARRKGGTTKQYAVDTSGFQVKKIPKKYDPTDWLDGTDHEAVEKARESGKKGIVVTNGKDSVVVVFEGNAELVKPTQESSPASTPVLPAPPVAPAVEPTKGIEAGTPPSEKKTQEDVVREALQSGPKSLKQLADELDIINHNIRRILGVGAKAGKFERIARGVYALKNKNGSYIYAQSTDAILAMPELAARGVKADFLFLDPPYKTAAIMGGNRGIKAYAMITPEDFNKIVAAAKVMMRTPDSPVYYMYSQAPSGLKDMQKYTDAFVQNGFTLVAKGGWTKTFKDGRPVTNVRGKVSEPEGIALFTLSGKTDAKPLPSLNFKSVRPPVAGEGGRQSQKPTELYSKLIGFHADELPPEKLPVFVTVDPFAGAGGLAAASREKGVSNVSLEMDEDAIQKFIIPKVEAAKEPEGNYVEPTTEPAPKGVRVQYKKKDGTWALGTTLGEKFTSGGYGEDRFTQQKIQPDEGSEFYALESELKPAEEAAAAPVGQPKGESKPAIFYKGKVYTGETIDAAIKAAKKKLGIPASRGIKGVRRGTVDAAGNFAASEPKQVEKKFSVKPGGLTEADGDLFAIVHDFGKIPIFIPDGAMKSQYLRIKRNLATGGVLSPKDRNLWERLQNIFPDDYEDVWGVRGEKSRAAYDAAKKAGIENEIFTVVKSAKKGQLDDHLDFIRNLRGKDFSAEDLWNLIEGRSAAHLKAKQGGEGKIASDEDIAEADDKLHASMEEPIEPGEENLGDVEFLPPEESSGQEKLTPKASEQAYESLMYLAQQMKSARESEATVKKFVEDAIAEGQLLEPEIQDAKRVLENWYPKMTEPPAETEQQRIEREGKEASSRISEMFQKREPMKPGDKVSFSGGDKWHADVSGTVFAVHNEGRIVDVQPEGARAGNTVRINLSDYGESKVIPPEPAKPVAPDLFGEVESPVPAGQAEFRRTPDTINEMSEQPEHWEYRIRQLDYDEARKLFSTDFTRNAIGYIDKPWIVESRRVHGNQVHDWFAMSAGRTKADAISGIGKNEEVFGTIGKAGDNFGKATEIKPLAKEEINAPKPVEVRPLTKDEQEELWSLRKKYAAARDEGAPGLTAEESRRMEWLEATGGQQELMPVKATVNAQAEVSTHWENVADLVGEYKSGKEFREDFEKNSLAEHNETETEYLNYKFCKAKNPVVKKGKLRALE